MILIGLMLEEHLKPDKTNTPSKAALWYFSISRLSLVLQHTHALVKPGLQLMRTALSLPFLNGIDVLEEDEKLPGSFILSVWEQKVVAGNAQGSSERWMEGLLRVTSSTLAVLMCSDNSISQRQQPPSGTSHAEFRELVGEPSRTLSSANPLQNCPTPCR